MLRPTTLLQGSMRNIKLKLVLRFIRTLQFHHWPIPSVSIRISLDIYEILKFILEKTSYQDFLVEYDSYFDASKLDHFIKERGTDENGEYIIFIDGLLEQKLKYEKSYKRIGPWPWAKFDHKNYRETRGMFLFSIWVGNVDIKEAENNKLIVRETKDGARQFRVMHDIGFSMGHVLAERPKSLKWDLIKRNKRNELVFDFVSIQDNFKLDHISMADAKWMVRKIAQLTKKQIRDAISIGGWPNTQEYPIGDHLVEKLASRRNSLVKAFGLEGEKLPTGKTISMLPINKFELDDLPGRKEGYTVDFDNPLKGKLKQIGFRGIPRVLAGLVGSAISSVQKIQIDPVEIGLEDGVISQFLFNNTRKIVRNTRPRTVGEAFLVKDTFLSGVRLGIGAGVSGDVALYREYTLVQGAETATKAKFHNNFVVSYALPGQVRFGRLPKNHVLIVSDFAEVRGRAKITTPGIGFGFGTEGTVSKIRLGRTIISKTQDDEILVYEDKSKYNQLAWRAFSKLGLVKSPFFKYNVKKGKLKRKIYALNITNDDPKKYNLAFSKCDPISRSFSCKKIRRRKRVIF